MFLSSMTGEKCPNCSRKLTERSSSQGWFDLWCPQCKVSFSPHSARTLNDKYKVSPSPQQEPVSLSARLSSLFFVLFAPTRKFAMRSARLAIEFFGRPARRNSKIAVQRSQLEAVSTGQHANAKADEPAEVGPTVLGGYRSGKGNSEVDRLKIIVRAMNQDILTVIEADGVFGELPTGLAGWEEVNLSACFVNYALERGEKGPFDSVRSEARRKYTTTAERTRIVLRALDVLLQQFRLENVAGGKQIVTKTKTTLSLGG